MQLSKVKEEDHLYEANNAAAKIWVERAYPESREPRSVQILKSLNRDEAFIVVD